jgi:iron complex transport system substrate-binding protein
LRIVTTESQSLAVPLIELGIMPVGTHGMMLDGVNPVMRSSATITGVDFDNSDVAFIGFRQFDLETIAALEPDLILHSNEVGGYTGVAVEDLAAIAPVFVLNSFNRPAGELHRVIATVVGADAELTMLEARYQAQLQQLINVTDPAETTVSIFLPEEGQIYAEHTWGTLGYVLRDAGFQFAPILDQIGTGQTALFSAEELQSFDADYVFLTYRNDAGQTPTDIVAEMEAMFPGWCDALTACTEGRLAVLPRDETAAPSFGSAMVSIFAVLPLLSDPMNKPS